MELLALESDKSARASLYSQTPLDIAPFEWGETRPISIARIVEIASPTASRPYDVLDSTGWSFRAALGLGYRLPVAGTFTLTFGANTTAALAYNATAAQLQTALNALASIIAAGSVDVAQIGDSDSGYFSISFRTNGTRAEMTSNATNLAPLSDVDVGTLLDGDSTHKEVQTIHISQSPATWVDLTTESAAAAVTITNVQTGGGGLNAKVRITLAPAPYDGQFSLTVRGIESAVIDFDASAAALTTALEGISISDGSLVTGAKYKIVSFATSDVFTNVGAASNATGVVFTATGTTPTTWTNGSVLSPVAAGNVNVAREADGQYLVTFQGDMANTAMGAITGSAAGLQVVAFKSGDLHLDVSGIELLLNGETEKTVTFCVRGTPGGGSPRIVFEQEVTLKNTIFTPATETPQPHDDYYSKAEGAVVPQLSATPGTNITVPSDAVEVVIPFLSRNYGVASNLNGDGAFVATHSGHHVFTVGITYLALPSTRIICLARLGALYGDLVAIVHDVTTGAGDDTALPSSTFSLDLAVDDIVTITALQFGGDDLTVRGDTAFHTTLLVSF